MKFKSIVSFIGGLFSKDGDEGRIPQGFLINAHNVNIDNTGRLERRSGYEELVDWDSFTFPRSRIQNIFYFSSISGNKFVGVITNGKLYLQVVSAESKLWVEVPFYDSSQSFGGDEKINVASYLDSVFFNREDGKVFLLSGLQLINNNAVLKLIYFSNNKLIIKEVVNLETEREVTISSASTDSLGKSIYEGILNSTYINTVATGSNGLYLSYCKTYIDELDRLYYLVLDNPKCIGTNRTSSNPFILKFDDAFRLIDYTSVPFTAGTSETIIFGFDILGDYIYINSKNDEISKILISNLSITTISGGLANYLSAANKVEVSNRRWYAIGVGEEALGIYSSYRQSAEDEIIFDHTNFNASHKSFRLLPEGQRFEYVFRDDASDLNKVNAISSIGDVYFLFSNINSYNILKKLTQGTDFTVGGDLTVKAVYNFNGNLYISYNSHSSSVTDKRGKLIVLNQSTGQVYNDRVLSTVGAFTDGAVYITKFVRDYNNDKLYACYNRSAKIGGNTTGHYISDVSNTAAIVNREVTGTNVFIASEIVSITTSHNTKDLLIILIRHLSGSVYKTHLGVIDIDPFSSGALLVAAQEFDQSSTSAFAYPPIDVEFAQNFGYIQSKKGQRPKIASLNETTYAFTVSEDTFQFNSEVMSSQYYYKRLEVLAQRKFLAFSDNQDFYLVDRINDRSDLIKINNKQDGLTFEWDRRFNGGNNLESHYSSRAAIDISKNGEVLYFIPYVRYSSGSTADNLPYILDVTYASTEWVFFKRFALNGDADHIETFAVSKSSLFFELSPILYQASRAFLNYGYNSEVWNFGAVLSNNQRYLSYSFYTEVTSDPIGAVISNTIFFGNIVYNNFFQSIENDNRLIYFFRDSSGYSVSLGDLSIDEDYIKRLVNKSSDDSFIPGFLSSYTNMLKASFIDNLSINYSDFLSLALLGAAKTPTAEIVVGTSGDDFYVNYVYRYYLVYVLVGGTTSPISPKPKAVVSQEISGSYVSIATFGSGDFLTGTLSNGDALGFIDGTDPVPSGISKNKTYFVVNATGTEFKISESVGGSAVSFDNSAATFLYYDGLQAFHFVITDINEFDEDGISIYERDDIDRIDLYRSEQPNGGVEGPKNFVASLEKDGDDLWFYTPGTPPFAEETYEDTVRVLASNIPDENLFIDNSCKDITVHKNRLILGNMQNVSNNNVIKYSDIDLARSIADDQIRAIESGDGDEIASILSLGDYLYIFKSSKIYAIYGDAPDGPIVDISKNIGAPYRHLISIFDNKVIYFLNDYGIHAISGVNYFFLSGDRLSNFFDSNRRDSIDFTNINKNGFSYVDNEKREIHFYVPRKVDGISQSQSNFCIIFNVEQQSFRTSSYFHNISDKADLKDLLTNEKKTVFGTYDGDIFQMSINRNDNGESILYKITTSEFFISSNFKAKRFKLIRVFGKFLKNMRISYFVDGKKYGGDISFRESYDGKGIATHYPMTSGQAYRIAISIEGEAKNDAPFSIEEILIGYTDLNGATIR